MNRIAIWIICFLYPLSALGLEGQGAGLKKPSMPMAQSIANSIYDFTKNNQTYIAYHASKGEELISEGAIGLLDVNSKTQLEASTIFPIASASHNFVAVSALLLQERGKLKLSDTISKHLDSSYWPAGKLPSWADKITIHHLLSHSHGLPEIYNNIIGEKKFYSRIIKVILSELSSKKLEFEPGKKASYSQTGFLILEAILEKAANTGLDKFYQKEFFDKFSMKDTFVVVPSFKGDAFSKKYFETKLPIKYEATTRMETPEEIEIRIINAEFETSMANMIYMGIYSNVSDLNKWLYALHNGKILSEESYEQMVTPYYKVEPDADSMISYFGYGLEISRMIGKIKFYNTTANMQGVRAEFIYIPSQDISISMLSNLSLLDIAKKQYKDKVSNIADISDLMINIFSVIRDNVQTQAVIDHGSKPA